MEPVLPNTPMRRLVNIDHYWKFSFSKNGPSVGGGTLRPSKQDALGRKAIHAAALTNTCSLLLVWGRVPCLLGAMSAIRINRVGLVMSELIPVYLS